MQKETTHRRLENLMKHVAGNVLSKPLLFTLNHQQRSVKSETEQRYNSTSPNLQQTFYTDVQTNQPHRMINTNTTRQYTSPRNGNFSLKIYNQMNN